MTAISRGSKPKRSAVPAQSTAAAMNGLAAERVNTGTSVAPSERRTRPSGVHAHAATACVDSTRAPRVTSTSGTPVSSALREGGFDDSGLDFGKQRVRKIPLAGSQTIATIAFPAMRSRRYLRAAQTFGDEIPAQDSLTGVSRRSRDQSSYDALITSL